MKKCDKCKTVELSDYEEIKFGLCWTCMSSDMNIVEDNPNIAEIKESEVNSEKFSVIVRDSNGTNFKMKTNKKTKKTTVSKEEIEAPIPKEKEDKQPLKQEEPIPIAKESEPVTEEPTTKAKEGKKEKMIEDEEDLKVVRESKEILTKSDRAKVRAYALINKALKETGNFELVVTLNETRETVSSMPFKEDSIEDIIMTTSMEVLNLDIKKKK